MMGNGKWDLEKSVVERFIELKNRVEAIVHVKNKNKKLWWLSVFVLFFREVYKWFFHRRKRTWERREKWWGNND